MAMGPAGRAATVVVGDIVLSALVNLATAAFDLTRLRWWLTSLVLTLGLVMVIVELRRPSNGVPGPAAEQALRGGPAAQRPAAASVGRPWMLPRPEATQVTRPDLMAKLRWRVLAASTGATVALHGGGGFGKTTLVGQLCRLPEVGRHFPGGLLWVTLGRHLSMPNLAGKINDLSALLSGARHEITDPEQAGYQLGELLAERARTLLVIDDVWDGNELRPFLLGGGSTTRIVTTRIAALLPETAETIRVDEMESAEARRLLWAGVGAFDAAVTDRLLRITGRWPLLLALANGALRRAARDGGDLGVAAARLADRIRAAGPDTLDIAVERRREHAARLSIEASLDLLASEHRARYAELAIFPPDTTITRAAVTLLWRATGGMADERTDQLCEELAELCLVQAYRRDDGSLRLHEVLRAYLRSYGGTPWLASVNGSFIAAARETLQREDAGAGEGTPWWRLPDEAQYLFSHLCFHLAEANLQNEVGTLVCDLRWVAEKIRRSGIPAVQSDVDRAGGTVPKVLRRVLAREAHLFAPIEPAEALIAILASRFSMVPELAALARSVPRDHEPRLVNRWALPDVAPALFQVLLGHVGSIYALAVAGDGSWMVTGGGDAMVRVWDLVDGVCLRVLEGHTAAVHAVAITSGDQWIVTAGGDCTVRVWDRLSGQQRTVVEDQGLVVFAVAVSRDGSWAASAGHDGSVRLFDLATGRIRSVLAGHRDWIHSVALAPDDSWLLSASADGTLSIWDVGTGEMRHRLHGHTGPVYACAVAPDGGWVASGGADGTVRTWDARTGAARDVFRGHTMAVAACSIAPDGSWIGSGGEDGTVRIWYPGAAIKPRVMAGHSDRIYACAVLGEGKSLVSAGEDRIIRLWDVMSPDTPEPHAVHTGWVRACSAADSRWLATAGDDRVIRVWDVSRAAVAVTLTGHTGPVSTCRFGRDGNWLASGGGDGTLRIWDVASGAMRHVLHHDGAWIHSCAIGSNGRSIVTASADGRVWLWDTQRGARLALISAHTGRARDCAVSSDGTWLVTAGGEDRTVRTWYLADGSAHRTLLGHTGAVYCCAVAPQASWLASGGEDQTVRIWDMTTGAAGEVLGGHRGPVYACAVSRDGRWLATGSGDGTLLLWDTAVWRARAAMRVDGAIYDACWLPDGEGLGVVGAKGVYVFDFVS